MHDDYGDEPSWPVALVVGILTFFVGIVVRIRTCVAGLFGRRPEKPKADDDR